MIFLQTAYGSAHYPWGEVILELLAVVVLLLLVVLFLAVVEAGVEASSEENGGRAMMICRQACTMITTLSNSNCVVNTEMSLAK